MATTLDFFARKLPNHSSFVPRSLAYPMATAASWAKWSSCACALISRWLLGFGLPVIGLLVFVPQADLFADEFVPITSGSGGVVFAAASSGDVGPNELVAHADAPADVAVVCPPSLLGELTPWIEHRRQQGYRMVAVDGRYPAAQIRRTIQLLAKSRGIRYVVIVGDADPAMSSNRIIRERSVPTFYTEAKIVKRWGSEHLIPSDNPYGDLDGDHVPELAVGRICVDSPSELRTAVRKILQYENRAAVGLWRRRVHFVAGVGGFGVITDALIEGAARKFITEEIPASYEATMTYASWRSPYFPDPRHFREVLLHRIDEGCLFWVYMGHGQRDRLDRIEAGESVLPILESRDVMRMTTSNGNPIAILLACYTGAFDHAEDCLAEEMYRQEQGPVAVISGSRVTMPYALAIFGSGLLDGFFVKQLPTVGEVFCHAKRILARPETDRSPNRSFIDGVAKTIGPSREDLPGERNEHQWLLNLIGDPLLAIPYPTPLPMQCSVSACEAGETIVIEGNSPLTGECTIELVCRRDELKEPMPRRRAISPTEEAFAELDATYWKANDQRYVSKTITVTKGAFRLPLQVPENTNGSCHVRGIVIGSRDCALGSTDIWVGLPPEKAHLGKANAAR
jgi:Peptidase family C25